MDESNLITLIVMVTFFGMIGFIAVRNSKEHHAKEKQERDKNRLSRLIDKVNRLFDQQNRTHDQLVHQDLYNHLVETVNDHMGQEHYEDATFFIEKALLEVKKHHKVLRARHSKVMTCIVPLINAADGRVLVEDDDEDKPSHTVDLNERYCSCQTDETRALDVDNARRICRHQVKVMRYQNIYPRFDDPYSGLILSASHRNQHYQILNVEDNKILIGYDTPLEWISVWFTEKFDRERFGFNILEKRWAYGEPPTGYAIKVRTAINKALHLI